MDPGIKIEFQHSGKTIMLHCVPEIPIGDKCEFCLGGQQNDMDVECFDLPTCDGLVFVTEQRFDEYIAAYTKLRMGVPYDAVFKEADKVG